MRQKLKEIGTETRERYKGTVGRCGIKYNGFKGWPERTLLVNGVIDDCTGEIITDHIWFTVGKTLSELDLKSGDEITFNARVGTYRKGKHFNKKDYKLNRLTQIEVKRADRPLESNEITTKTPTTMEEYYEACAKKQREYLDKEYFELLEDLNLFDNESKDYTTDDMYKLNKKLQEEALVKQQELVNKGLYPFKKIPFGYEKSNNTDEPIVIVQEKAEIIYKLFEEVAEKGVSERVYKKFAPLLSNKKKLKKSQILNLLMNPVYIGKIKWEKSFYLGKHEAILSEQLYNKVQHMLKVKI